MPGPADPSTPAPPTAAPLGPRCLPHLAPTPPMDAMPDLCHPLRSTAMPPRLARLAPPGRDLCHPFPSAPARSATLRTAEAAA